MMVEPSGMNTRRLGCLSASPRNSHAGRVYDYELSVSIAYSTYVKKKTYMQSVILNEEKKKKVGAQPEPLALVLRLSTIFSPSNSPYELSIPLTTSAGLVACQLAIECPFELCPSDSE